MDMSLSKLRGMVKDREAWGHKESDMTERLNNEQQNINRIIKLLGAYSKKKKSESQGMHNSQSQWIRTGL